MRYRVVWQEFVSTNNKSYPFQKDIKDFSESFKTRKEAEDFAKMAEKTSNVRFVKLLDTITKKEVKYE